MRNFIILNFQPFITVFILLALISSDLYVLWSNITSPLGGYNKKQPAAARSQEDSVIEFSFSFKPKSGERCT